MRYKIGNKVKITTELAFVKKSEDDINAYNPDRIFTICRIEKEKYLLKGLKAWRWNEEWLTLCEPIYESIESRFEILDL